MNKYYDVKNLDPNKLLSIKIMKGHRNMKRIYQLQINENDQLVLSIRISGKEFKEQYKKLTKQVNVLNEDIENVCLCLPEYKKDYPHFIVKSYTFRFNLTDATLYVFECKKGYKF